MCIGEASPTERIIQSLDHQRNGTASTFNQLNFWTVVCAWVWVWSTNKKEMITSPVRCKQEWCGQSVGGGQAPVHGRCAFHVLHRQWQPRDGQMAIAWKKNPRSYPSPMVLLKVQQKQKVFLQSHWGPPIRALVQSWRFPFLLGPENQGMWSEDGIWAAHSSAPQPVLHLALQVTKP